MAMFNNQMVGVSEVGLPQNTWEESPHHLMTNLWMVWGHLKKSPSYSHQEIHLLMILPLLLLWNMMGI